MKDQRLDIFVFEDSCVPRLHPVTIGRPAYAITCGGYRLLDWLTQLSSGLQALVRPHLWEIQQIDYPQFNLTCGSQGARLLVNARLVPSLATYQALRNLIRSGRPGRVGSGSNLAAVLLPEAQVRQPTPSRGEYLATYLQTVGVADLEPLAIELPMFEYPHDVIRHHVETIGDILPHRIEQGNYQQIQDGVFLADGARLGPHVVCDTKDGPILLEENAHVGPHCFLSGPAVIGRNARLIEHAAIKDAVSIGHTTKIGGEVEASVIEPYTNKQHYGFLGHSYLGSWINLGAGTCNSDLKNTYGNINMEYGGERVATGMQFVGCVMGDYAKTAVNTSIFTGKTIGTCSMVYGFVTTNVPSFVNYARLFGQVTELPAEVMIAAQQRMFVRRNVTQRPCDIQLIRDMYELSREERQASGDQLSL